jgi:hypothetical protein
MCSPAPPPTLATALLHSQVLWFGSFLVLLILWPCLTDGFYLLRGGRSRTRTMVLVLSAIGYGAAFTSIAFATMDLAWQDAVMAWDGAQIDALERHDCAIAILAAVDQRSTQLGNTPPVASYAVYAAILLALLAFAARGVAFIARSLARRTRGSS